VLTSSLQRNRVLVLAVSALSFAGLSLPSTASAQDAPPSDDQYCGVRACPGDGGGPSSSGGADGGASPGGRTGAPSAGGQGPSGGSALGPDRAVAPASSGGTSSRSSGGDGARGEGRGRDTASSDPGFGYPTGEGATQDGGRSFGELLSDTSEPLATQPAPAPQRAAQEVSQDGGKGLIWLLIALGAITAVAATGVAARRRHAKRGL
jgi:hypothetical protein